MYNFLKYFSFSFSLCHAFVIFEDSSEITEYFFLKYASIFYLRSKCQIEKFFFYLKYELDILARDFDHLI